MSGRLRAIPVHGSFFDMCYDSRVNAQSTNILGVLASSLLGVIVAFVLGEIKSARMFSVWFIDERAVT